ncbi:LytTR family DNA-binding domain-containing protein [Fluviicola sp.]|uniref:LytR/AlgR family response regulator transcription factor n=1 Tax=Fluviicola sp. TaxID=1917219 RepID=UPI0031D733AB
MKNELIRCIIVDDELMARRLIEDYVAKTPFLSFCGSFGSVVEALTVLNAEQIDLVFLDIQMPEVNGIELSRMLPRSTRVIFTTAFDQYAIEGFRVEALDYLLKPFNYQEFLAASNKALEWFSLTRNALKSEDLKSDPAENPEFIFVKSEYKQLKIALNEVLYFEGWRDYVKIWLSGHPKPVLSILTLKSLEETLPADRFMRIHRSFIINLNQIEAIERSQVLIGSERITVAEQYKVRFAKYIADNSPEA